MHLSPLLFKIRYLYSHITIRHAALQELSLYIILNTHQIFLLYLKISAVTRLQIQKPGKALCIFSPKTTLKNYAKHTICQKQHTEKTKYLQKAHNNLWFTYTTSAVLTAKIAAGITE